MTTRLIFYGILAADAGLIAVTVWLTGFGRRGADSPVPGPCEVHVPGRDRPSPWCAACRLSGAGRG